MRILLIIAVAAWIPVVAQPGPAATLETLLAEARRAQARSDFHAAAAAYRKAVALRPDLAELRSNLGLMHHQAGEYAQAMDAFRQALHLNQSLFVPNLFMGLDLVQLARTGEAVPYLLTAAKLAPDDPQPALALGRAFHALWEPEKSRLWYQRAIVLVPRSGEAWYGLGLAYFGLAEASGAKLTGSFRESVYVAELAAAALAEQDRLTEAVHAYRVLLRRTAAPPRCARASYGFVLILHGDPAEAEQEFRRDLDSCPAARVGMARFLFESGGRENALAVLTDLANSDQDGFDSSLPRFWEGLDAEQLEKRMAQLRQSTDVTAGVVLARMSEGVRSTARLELERPIPALGGLAALERFASGAFFSGHFRTAALASDRLRQSYPNDPAGWYWAVRANQKLGVAALARAGDVEPDSPRIHALLGDTYLRRRMFDEARREYSKMLAISSDSVAGLAGLAATGLAENKFEAARISASKALEHSPADGEVNLLMGEILVAQNEYAAAEPYLKRGLRSRPDLLPHAHALLGRVFAATGREKAAIEELRQGVASDEDGSVYYQLARLYQKTGDPKAAVAALNKSKQIQAQREDLAQRSLMPSN